jgi:hypothetical protein
MCHVAFSPQGCGSSSLRIGSGVDVGHASALDLGGLEVRRSRQYMLGFYCLDGTFISMRDACRARQCSMMLRLASWNLAEFGYQSHELHEHPLHGPSTRKLYFTPSPCPPLSKPYHHPMYYNMHVLDQNGIPKILASSCFNHFDSNSDWQPRCQGSFLSDPSEGVPFRGGPTADNELNKHTENCSVGARNLYQNLDKHIDLFNSCTSPAPFESGVGATLLPITGMEVVRVDGLPCSAHNTS